MNWTKRALVKSYRKGQRSGRKLMSFTIVYLTPIKLWIKDTAHDSKDLYEFTNKNRFYISLK